MFIDLKANGLNGKVDSGVEESIRKWLGGDISGAELKDEKYRKLWRVSHNGNTFYIKKFIHTSIIQRLRFSIFKSKGRLEFENLYKLSSLGLSVPTPLGFLESDSKDSSLLFLQEISDARTLRDYIDNEQLDYESRRKLLMNLAKLVRVLHEAGLEDDDLHCGNILIDKDCKLYLIDLHRARFKNTLSLKEKTYSIAFLVHSFYKNFTSTDVVRFLHFYFGSKLDKKIVHSIHKRFVCIKHKWEVRHSKGKV